MAALEEVYNKIGELLKNPANKNLIVYVDTEIELHGEYHHHG